MSTIKVNKIENTATANGGIAIDASGHVQIDGVQLPTAGALSHRNLVVNGAFQVDQRNSGSSLTCSSGENKYAADRGRFLNLGTGELVLTLQQVTDAPAGFRNSNKVTVTTAESSGATPAADDRASMQMRLEGNTVESLALGTSDAKDFVVSFYVKSSQTGNFGVAFVGTDRSYPVLYNIASANTWERKVIKVPGPTDGTWGTGSSQGFALKFGLYTGSDRDGPDQGTAGTGTWQTNATPQGVENQVQLGGTASATWQITGVQLEVGDKATPFEHRSYADELARCQRYYNMVAKGNGPSMLNFAVYATNNAYGVLNFPVHMRATPTVDSSDGTGHFQFSSAAAQDNFDTLVAGNGSERAIELRANSSGGLGIGTAGNAGWARLINASAFIGLSSEL